MRISVSLYHRHRVPNEIISHCVWLYFRFALSFRDVEEMLAMRGVSVSYETVRQWCLKFICFRSITGLDYSCRSGAAPDRTRQIRWRTVRPEILCVVTHIQEC